jgi:SAM-dependent methyltransferase
MITEPEFMATGRELSREAKVLDTLHQYFAGHCHRLYGTCARFGLLEKDLGEVLEIGPFYSYTPFLLRPNSRSFTVLEGDDPAAYPLKPLYEEHRISVRFVDLFDLFGPTPAASHRLPFGDESFDTLLCWETMEHFGFSPVKFARELRRVLKPAGCAYITVPNRASFQNMAGLVSGRLELENINSYYTYEDYACDGKKVFYGFHWREYSAPELGHLFARAGFSVLRCGTFVAFSGGPEVPLLRRLARGAAVTLARLMPRYGTHVFLVAQK